MTESIQRDSIVNVDALKYHGQTIPLSRQRDIIDIGLIILNKNPSRRLDSNQTKSGHIHISGSPAPEYSLATGIAFNITGNIAFYTSERIDENISAILLAPTITQKQQYFLPIQSSVWTKGNKYNIVSDWRIAKYPQDTYGLGGLTLPTNATRLDYYYVRLYSFVERNLGKDFYAGLGYQYDNHWNIQQLDIPAGTLTDFDKYGFSRQSVSSAVSANFLFDNRRNSINPRGGFYSNIIFRQNLRAIGSNANWESLIIDVRKYIHLSERSENMLCFWSYNWLVINGTPPYLDLPSTAWDTYSNTGRGYIQSRYRSRNMVDLEAEYRFAILKNGLLGGVIFANAQSYAETNGRFESIDPGYGAGLRIKFNKFSRTNICVDYAFGLHGSSGLFLNLGEVF